MKHRRSDFGIPHLRMMARPGVAGVTDYHFFSLLLLSHFHRFIANILLYRERAIEDE